MSTLRISIITPCLNRAGFIAEAIESVLAQDYPDVEHIVVDGGSTDGTLGILAKYPHLTVVSEPDSGLYDALNKGIAMAGGEVIGLLNSDDFYAPGILAGIAARFEADPAMDMVSGGAVVFEEQRGGRHLSNDYSGPEFSRLSLEQITVGVPVINARFFRRSLFARVGPFDTAYRIAADRELLLRLSVLGVKQDVVDGVVYHYRRHGESLSINRTSREVSGIIAEHLNMAETYLRRADLPAPVRRACRRWHVSETVEGLESAIRDGDLRRAAGYGWRGWRRNPLWPFAAAAAVIRKLVRAVARRCHGR